MKEVAFIVKKDRTFYSDYFKQKQEKQRFHDLARAFFKKYQLDNHARYCQTNTLILDLTAEQKEKYKAQIKKNANANGMWVFKKNSALQKAWQSEVVGNVDMPMIDKATFWWLPYATGRCSYALWDYNGEIYGYFQNKDGDYIKLPEYFEQIKMSEYYHVIEEQEKAE